MRRTPRSARTVAARFLPVRIQAVAARVESTNGEGIFTIKATAKSVTIAQIQTPRERLPARSKKNQTGAIDLQLNPRRIPNAPLKTKQQATQTELRNSGSKSRGQMNASSALAKNAQEKILMPKSLLHKRRGKHQRRPTAATRRTWCTAATATLATPMARRSATLFGPHEEEE